MASKKRVFWPPVMAVAGPPATDHDEMPPFCAVTVEPFRPNEMPFEFEKVTALRLFEVVPAETLKL